MSNADPIGGYFEYELISNRKDSQERLLFNSGRSSLAFLLKLFEIDFIQIPYYTCEVILEPLELMNIEYSFYSLTPDLLPDLSTGEIESGQPILITNYFGVLDERLKSFPLEKAIIDNSQALYSNLIGGKGGFNSFRKFIGVPDGSEVSIAWDTLSKEKKTDYSMYKKFRASNSLGHLFGRIESGPEAFYEDFKKADLTLKFNEVNRISELSYRTLQLIDHKFIKNTRVDNFNILNSVLKDINELEINMNAKSCVPMCYPFLIENGKELKKDLIGNNVFIPTYWPNSKIRVKKGSYEEYLIDNLLPLPIDQRYGAKEMSRILILIQEFGK